MRQSLICRLHSESIAECYPNAAHPGQSEIGASSTAIERCDERRPLRDARRSDPLLFPTADTVRIISRWQCQGFML
jgi:hypothetical protein